MSLDMFTDDMVADLLKHVEDGPYKVEYIEDLNGRPWYVRSRYGLDMGRFKDKEDAEAHAKRLDKVLK